VPAYIVRQANDPEINWLAHSDLWAARRIVWAPSQSEAAERAGEMFRGELRVERIAFGHSDTGARVRVCR
jgi:hypothetical protein